MHSLSPTNLRFEDFKNGFVAEVFEASQKIGIYSALAGAAIGTIPTSLVAWGVSKDRDEAAEQLQVQQQTREAMLRFVDQYSSDSLLYICE